jgi:hypothetical protein
MVVPPATEPVPAPAETPQQPAAPAPQSETGRPGFDLGFDPSAKASLPFELPGQGDADAESAVAALLPAPSFTGGAPAAMDFSAPSMPLPAFQPMAGAQDFLQAAPRVAEAPTGAAAPQNPPKVLHIRCPSGHLVKVKSNLLGRNGRCPVCKETFELRYEDRVEVPRRKEKTIVKREDETKSGKAWIAWALLGAFVGIAGLVALMLALSR